MPMSPRLLRPRASGLVLPTDADARAYVLAVNSADQQPLEPLVVQAIDAFVIGCKADGIWSAIKASCILMGARTLSGALTPLVGSAPTNNGPFVSGDYNRKTGLVGNGSTKFLNSNRNSAADPQDSHHISVYVATANNASGRNIMGAGNTGASGCTVLHIPFGSAYMFVYNRNSQYWDSPSGNAAGWQGVTRSGSSSFTVRAQGSSSTSNIRTSQTPPNVPTFVFATNNAGTATGLYSGRLAFYSIGENLNLNQLDSRVTTLYNTIGAAI